MQSVKILGKVISVDQADNGYFAISVISLTSAEDYMFVINLYNSNNIGLSIYFLSLSLRLHSCCNNTHCRPNPLVYY